MAGNAGSLGGSNVGFDLNSQRGVMAVLQAVRNSSLSLEEQNEIRDLVFLYANGGGDQEIKSQLEAKLSELKLAPATTQTTTPSQPVKPAIPSVGQSRPVPKFKPATIKPVVAAAPSTPPAPKPNPVPPLPAPAPAPVPPPPAPPVSSAPPPASIPEPKKEPTPAPVTPPPTPPAAPVPEPASAPTVPTQVPVSSAAGDTGALNRIREIKLEVNKQVGNPVNLVDIDNQVGREYMTALLEAMKKINGGQPAEVDAAMQRLETAFVKVKEVVAAAPAGALKPLSPKQVSDMAAEPVVPPAPPAPKPDPVVPPPPPAPAAPPPPPPVPAPAPEPIPAPVPPPPPPKPTPAPVPDVSSQFKEPGSLKALADEARLGQKETSVPTPPTQQPTNAPASSGWASDAASEQSSGLAARIASLTANAAPSAPSTPLPATPAVPPTPVATPASASVPVPDMSATPSVPAAPNPNSPLMAPEVTSGLEQLLSEWSLFKSSGLFGTGPHGSEHPLYLKLKNISVTNILAGRYEGAKPEIKQSVTDYMNGWRYEQGIIYEPGETFEQYLRRVIRHIIDSKNQ